MSQSVAKDTFHCSVVTPERMVLDTEATFVAFPAHDGEVGILKHRAPLLYRLGIGVMRIESGREKIRLFIDGGFAQMLGDKLTILTEQARKPDEVDAAAARADLEKARGLTVTTDDTYTARQKAVARAQAKLHLASAG